MTKAAYTGNEQIHIRDGSSLDIHQIGCSPYQSSFNSKVLSLNQLLHVSSIAKNLLSVSKFAANNKVYFVFFSTICYVRDQVSHNILMEDKLKDDAYAVDPPQFISQPSQTSLPSVSSQRSCRTVNKASVSSLLYSDSLEQCHKDQTNTFKIWHNRLGHPSSSVVKSVMANCKVPNVNKMTQTFCTAFCIEKIHNLPFLHLKMTVKPRCKLFTLIFEDLLQLQHKWI